MDVISAISNSIAIVSRLKEVSKNVSEAEIKNLLADLQNELADTKMKIVDLKEEIVTLRQENQQLKKSNPENKEKPSGVKWGCYQFAGNDGLYCTACYDTKGQKNRTTRATSKFRMCPVCNAVFGS